MAAQGSSVVGRTLTAGAPAPPFIPAIRAARGLAPLNLPRFRLHSYAAIRRRPSPGQFARSNSSGLR